MPMYEYQCKKCKHIFEKIMQYSDKPLKNCPDCGAKNSLEQTISAPAFQFKGAGWYVTDYAKKSGKSDKADGKGKSEKSESSGSDSSGGESSSGESKNNDSKSSDSKGSDSSSGDSESSAKLVESKPKESKSEKKESGKKSKK